MLSVLGSNQQGASLVKYDIALCKNLSRVGAYEERLAAEEEMIEEKIAEKVAEEVEGKKKKSDQKDTMAQGSQA